MSIKTYPAFPCTPVHSMVLQRQFLSCNNRRLTCHKGDTLDSKFICFITPVSQFSPQPRYFQLVGLPPADV